MKRSIIICISLVVSLIATATIFVVYNNEKSLTENFTPLNSSLTDLNASQGSPVNAHDDIVYENLLSFGATNSRANGVELSVIGKSACSLRGKAAALTVFKLGSANVTAGKYKLSGISAEDNNVGKCCLQFFKNDASGVAAITQFDAEYSYSKIELKEQCEVTVRAICYSGWSGEVTLKPNLERIPDSEKCDVFFGGEGYARPMMTFIDDDGKDQFIEKWLPVMHKYEIPVSCAVVTNWINGDSDNLDQDQLSMLKENGTEIVCHTETHDSSDYINASVKEITDSYQRAKDTLSNYGFNTNAVVYCGDTGDYHNNKAAARNVFEIGIHSGGGLNFKNRLNLFCLGRYNALPEGATFDNYYKAKIDQAIAGNGWLIWMTHSQYSHFNETAIEQLSLAIEYAKNKSVEIVNLETGLNATIS